jgi:phage repressor protein C with HTH and peptisase S24 domain/DNA-binding XRE family transcriptional regulator
MKTARMAMGKTRAMLAAEVGVSTAAIQKYEDGKSTPSAAVLRKLAEALDMPVYAISVGGLNPTHILSPEEYEHWVAVRDLPVNAAQLMERYNKLGSDAIRLADMYRKLDKYGKLAVKRICSTEYNRIQETSPVDLRRTRHRGANAEERFIPFYYSAPAAGGGTPSEGDDYTMVRVDKHVPEGAEYALRVNGRSMEPCVSDNEMVYVETITDLRQGDIGIFAVDGEMLCKQYYKLDDTVHLISLNPELRRTNIVATAESGIDIRALGRVLAKSAEIPAYFVEELKR